MKRWRRRTGRWLAVAAISSALAGCSVGDQPTLSPVEHIPATNGDFYGVAWTTHGIIVGIRLVQPPISERLAYVDRATGATTPTSSTTPDPGCIRNDNADPVALADGRVAFLDVCFGPGPAEVSSTIRTYDPKTGTTALLASLDPLRPTGGQFSPNPDGSRLVIGVGNQLCNAVSVFDGSRLATPAITISDGGRQFRLDTISDGHGECDSNAIANWPDWAPDGKTIAFVASTAAIGLGGPGRLDTPFTIWTLDTTSLTASALITGIGHPRSLRWSPDGHTIAISGQINGQSGTWAVEASTGKARLVTTIKLAWLAWSPDGRNLVGNHQIDDANAELVIVVVPAVALTTT